MSTIFKDIYNTIFPTYPEYMTKLAKEFNRLENDSEDIAVWIKCRFGPIECVSRLIKDLDECSISSKFYTISFESVILHLNLVHRRTKMYYMKEFKIRFVYKTLGIKLTGSNENELPLLVVNDYENIDYLPLDKDIRSYRISYYRR